MKKSILVIFALIASFAFITTANAQIQWGIKGGVNLNSISLSGDLSNNFTTSNNAGFFVGGIVDFKIPILGFGADVSLQYENKKATTGEIDGIENGGLTYKTETSHYLSLPINIKHTFSIGSVASVYLATGPQFTTNFCYKKNENAVAPTTVAKSENKKLECYWNVGGGFTLFKHYRLGYTYNIPLSSAASTAVGTKECTFKNKTHQIFFAYMF